jgi:hypothetical protein
MKEVKNQVLLLGHSFSFSDFENSELLLYKNMLIEESNNFEAALNELDKVEAKIVDKLSLKEKRGFTLNNLITLEAEFLIKLNRLTEAEKQYKELMHINPENRKYHLGLQQSLKLLSEG